MSVRSLYPLTGTLVLIATGALLYGLHSSSPIMFVEGLFLMWIGIQITMNAWDSTRSNQSL